METLPNNGRGIPLDVDGQFEMLGELLSAQAKIRMLESGGALLLLRAREQMLLERIKSLEQCRADLTKLVQELEQELNKKERKR